MADMSVEEIDAELVLLRTYRSARLRGETRIKVGYDGTSIEKAIPTLEEIRMEIAGLENKRARLTGVASGNGPMGFGFGGRL